MFTFLKSIIAVLIACCICLWATPANAVNTDRISILFPSTSFSLGARAVDTLKKFVNEHPGSNYLIVANKYNDSNHNKVALVRKYSLMRALLTRKLLIEQGIDLSAIEIRIITNPKQANDELEIFLKQS